MTKKELKKKLAYTEQWLKRSREQNEVLEKLNNEYDDLDSDLTLKQAKIDALEMELKHYKENERGIYHTYANNILEREELKTHNEALQSELKAQREYIIQLEGSQCMCSEPDNYVCEEECNFNIIDPKHLKLTKRSGYKIKKKYRHIYE